MQLLLTKVMKQAVFNHVLQIILINSHGGVKSTDGGVDKASDDGVKDKREHLEKDDKVKSQDQTLKTCLFSCFFW